MKIETIFYLIGWTFVIPVLILYILGFYLTGMLISIFGAGYFSLGYLLSIRGCWNILNKSFAKGEQDV